MDVNKWIFDSVSCLFVMFSRRLQKQLFVYGSELSTTICCYINNFLFDFVSLGEF